MTEPAPLAVYVHWPYCARICPYCDFNVVRDRRQPEQAALVDAIIADLERQARRIGSRRLTSIFLGGGTPSLMEPGWTARIIQAARRLWPAQGAVEITLEANPTDAEAGRFAAFHDAGVDRLSLGVQAFEDAALAFLGRNHSAVEARRAVEIALKVFPRVSLDLIYALPGQTSGSWALALKEAAAMGPEHISPYQLTIEPGTAFDRMVARKAFAPADPDRAADLYETTQAVLADAGFQAYEVSNHARGEGARSIHNLAYWRGWDYIGAGPGAHGRLTIDGARIATHGARKVADYIGGGMDEEHLRPRDVAIERLLLGLRTYEGVGLAELEVLGLDLAGLDDPERANLLIVHEGRIAATQAGRAVLDRLLLDLIPE